MGLLGGFKAKLIGKQKKNKNDSKQVVCLKFEVYSEFDPSPSTVRTPLPSCSNTNPGRNDVIKGKRPVVKPEIKNFWPSRNGEVKTNESDKRPEIPKTVVDDGNFNIQIKQNGTSSSEERRESIDHDGNFNIHIANPPSMFEKMSKKDNGETSAKPIEDDDDGNFKIHFSQTSAPFGSQSSDEDSEAEDMETDRSKMTLGYSSQAESIFFGGEEQPLTNRPRNFIFTDDDVDDGALSEGSSASA